MHCTGSCITQIGTSCLASLALAASCKLVGSRWVGCKSNISLTVILCDLCKYTNTRRKSRKNAHWHRGVADCQVASPDGCCGIRHQQTVEWPQPELCRQVAQIHKYKHPCQNFSTNFKFTNTNTNNTNTNTIKLTVEPTGYVSDYLLLWIFRIFFFRIL